MKPEPELNKAEPPILPTTDASEDPELIVISPAFMSLETLDEDLELDLEDDVDIPTFPVEIDTDPLKPLDESPDDITNEPEPVLTPLFDAAADMIETEPLDPDVLRPLDIDTDPPAPEEDRPPSIDTDPPELDCELD